MENRSFEQFKLKKEAERTKTEKKSEQHKKSKKTKKDKKSKSEENKRSSGPFNPSLKEIEDGKRKLNKKTSPLQRPASPPQSDSSSPETKQKTSIFSKIFTSAKKKTSPPLSPASGDKILQRAPRGTIFKKDTLNLSSDSIPSDVLPIISLKTSGVSPQASPVTPPMSAQSSPFNRTSSKKSPLGRAIERQIPYIKAESQEPAESKASATKAEGDDNGEEAPFEFNSPYTLPRGDLRRRGLVSNLPTSPESKKKTKKSKTLETLNEEFDSTYARLQENQYSTTQEKVSDLITAFSTMAELDIEAKLLYRNFNLENTQSLRNLQRFLLDKKKFTKKDLEALQRCIQDKKDFNQQALTPSKLNLYITLNNMITMQQNTLMLRTTMYSILALTSLVEKELQTKSHIKLDEQTAQNRKVRLLQKQVTNFNNKYRDTKSEIQYLEELAKTDIKEYKKPNAIKKPVRPLNNRYVNLDNAINACETLCTALFTDNNQTMFTSDFDRKKAWKDLYFAAENVILYAAALLADPRLSMSDTKELDVYFIMAYYTELRDLAFSKSLQLQQELAQEKEDEKLARNTCKKIDFYEISRKILNFEIEKSPAKFEEDSFKEALRKDSPKADNDNANDETYPKIIKLGGGNNCVFRFVGENGSFVVRSFISVKVQERLGRSAQNCRLEACSSLNGGMTTRLIQLIPGATDPSSKIKMVDSKRDEECRRDYEVSQDIPNCVDLFDFFVQLHAAHTIDKSPNAVLAMQINLIKTFKEITKEMIRLGNFNVTAVDLKPKNVLCQLEDGGDDLRVKEFKISDIKGHRPPVQKHDEENRPFYVGMIEDTRNFSTDQTFVKKDKVTGEGTYNLEVFRRETLCHTLAQIVALKHFERMDGKDGAQKQYEQLKLLLTGQIRGDIAPLERKVVKDGLETKEQIEVPAISIEELVQGDLGRDVQVILNWLIAYLNEEISLEGLVGYLEKPAVQKRLEAAEKQLYGNSKTVSEDEIKESKQEVRRVTP